MMKRNSILTLLLITLTSAGFLTGCARGEDDPWISLHTRDARLTQKWRLVGMTGSIVNTTDSGSVNIEYEFDGTTLYVTTNNKSDSYAYSYDLDIRDNGEVFSEELKTAIGNGAIVSQSSQTSYWYWGRDNENKTSVSLDITGEIFETYLTYDISRLAYNDMTMNLDFTDNYTELVQLNDSTTAYMAGSNSVLLELMWEVNLDE